MWNNPHILVMDEPTNFLDRDSLGALAMAIKSYDGGVVVISHNREFTGTVCPEEWQVGSGVCTVVGANYSIKIKEKVELQIQARAGLAGQREVALRTRKGLQAPRRLPLTRSLSTRPSLHHLLTPSPFNPAFLTPLLGAGRDDRRVRQHHQGEGA